MLAAAVCIACRVYQQDAHVEISCAGVVRAWKAVWVIESVSSDDLLVLVVRREVLAYKLVDCPELGYTTADKPHPRGELRIKTKRMIPGYFKRPEVRAFAPQH